MRIGSVLVVGTIVLLVLGIWCSVKFLGKGGWSCAKSESFVETVMVVPGNAHRSPTLNMPSFPYSLRIKDIGVSGTVSALGKEEFNFYVFDEPNYENWKVGLPVDYFVCKKNIPSCYLSFLLSSVDQARDLHLVVENPSAEEISVRYDVDIHWNEKISWGLGFLALAVAFTSIGVILLIPARESLRRKM